MKLFLSPLLSVLLAVLLQGCQGAPTRFYTLYPVPPETPPAVYGGPPVKVDTVHLPSALNRTEVLSSLSDGQVQIHDLAYWSEPLRESAPRIFSADLMERLPEGKVAFPSLPKPEGALGIDVDVLQFTVGATGAELRAGWLIQGPDADRRGAVTLHRAAPGTDAKSVVDTLSRLLGELADRVTASLTSAGAR